MALCVESLRNCLSRFSTFSNCIDEQSSTEGHVVVRTSVKDKDDVRQWLGEFAAVAGVSYVIEKVHKEGKKLFARSICVTMLTGINL